jgi:rhodanese-related sulfurtransferase
LLGAGAIFPQGGGLAFKQQMEVTMSKIRNLIFAGAVLLFFVSAPGVFANEMAAKLNAVLTAGPAEKFWQIQADEIASWIKEKRDFVVVDVRPNPAEYGQGHIPGAIQVPVQNILTPQGLAKLPKDKTLVLVCVTGQTQNLPVVALRALGYNAYTMAFGYASWIKGYHGAQMMQQAIKNAETKNFPLTK